MIPSVANPQQMTRRPYPYIATGSIGRHLNEWHRLILRDAGVDRLLKAATNQTVSIKTDIKTRVTSTGRLRARRFYWSLQVGVGANDHPFFARTLSVGPDLSAQWFDFPDDPVLYRAPKLMGLPGKTQILQYVPLRRLTVLNKGSQSTATVLKVKREGRIDDACLRLSEAINAVGNRDVGFLLSTALASCSATGAQRQSYCSGQPLNDYLHTEAAIPMVADLGQRLARFHSSMAGQLPESSTVDDINLTHNVSWLCAVWPAAAERIKRVQNWLLRNRPGQITSTLCHGDLSPDQILIDQARWSLIDLDHAHCGDPVRDFSRLLTRLYAHLPGTGISRATLRDSLLAGYGWDGTDPVNASVMRWHCCLCEIEQLSTLLRKDLGGPEDRAACLACAENLMRGSL